MHLVTLLSLYCNTKILFFNICLKKNKFITQLFFASFIFATTDKCNKNYYNKQNKVIEEGKKSWLRRKNVSISCVLFFTLHGLLVVFTSFCQDTIYVNDESIPGISKYKARDSVHVDLRKKQLHLYGDVFVESEGITLKAGYILIDLESQELTATYMLDENDNIVEQPIFNMGQDEVIATTLKYNLNTKKAYIEGVRIKQDEMHLHMGNAKRQKNEEIHFTNGKFTTCDLDEPHYHFQLSRAILIPHKRIVTGPMNLYIAGVPTPFGLPFGFFPQKGGENERTHGLLFPEFVPMSEYGIGLNNLGYYLPINDHLQTSLYLTAYARGSWGFRDNIEYAKRYGYTGNIDINIQQFKRGFPDNTRTNNTAITWIHRKDAKSHPLWNFNTNINFNSSNNTKNNLDPINQHYFKNTLMSDINLTRTFPGKPYRVAAKISMSQNSSSQNIALTSPTINFSTNQFFPLKKRVKNELFQRLGIIYNIEGQNKSTFKDSLLREKNYSAIGSHFIYGMRQQATVQTTGGLFKNVLKVTPSINYSTFLNFQQTRNLYDSVNNNTIQDTIHQAGIAHSLSMNVSATSALYTYYRIVGKNKPILRHIITPNISYSYRPLITRNITDNVGVNKVSLSYSPYTISAYSYSATKDQGIINFGINNSFELKRKSDKDTVTGFQKIRIIDALSITGSYDVMSDSMNFSNLNINMRVSPFPWVNVVVNNSYSLYGWNDSTNSTVKEFALRNNNRLGRMLNNSVSTTFTATTSEGRKKIIENQEIVSDNWQADYDYFYLHPERIVDFSIPWRFNISHVWNLNRNTFKTSSNTDEFQSVQTLNIDMDLSFTKRWKLSSVINWDFKEKKITNAYFTLNRDMHCWALTFRWTPIGFNKSFLLTIRNTSSIFKDAKLDFRRPPAFL